MAVEESRGREVPLKWALLILGVLFFLACVPIWTVEFPPLVDYPMHVARAYLLSLPQNGQGITEFYQASWQPLPNLGMDILVSQLMHFLPPMAAGKVFLCIIQLCLLTGGFALSVAVVRKVTVAAFLPALALFDQWFWMGFANYLFGLGLALWATALWFWSTDWPAPRRWLTLVPVGAVLLVCHLMAFLVWLGMMIVFSLKEDEKRTIKVISVCFGLCFAAYLALQLTNRTPIRWEGRYATLLNLVGPNLFGYAGLFVLLTVPFVQRSRATMRVLIALGIFTAFGPSFLGGTAFACDRLSLPFLLVALATAVPNPKSSHIFAGLLLVCGALTLTKATLWRDDAQQTAEVMRALRSLPVRSTLASFDMGLRHRYTWKYQRHVPDWLLIEKPVFVAQNFAKKRQQPMVFRPEFEEWHAYQNNNPVEVDSWEQLQSEVPRLLDMEANLRRAYEQSGRSAAGLYALVFHEKGQPRDLPGAEVVARGDQFTLLRILGGTSGVQ